MTPKSNADGKTSDGIAIDNYIAHRLNFLWWCLHRFKGCGVLRFVHFFLRKQLNRDRCELCWRTSGCLPDVAGGFFFVWLLGVDPCRKDKRRNRVSTAKASKTRSAINYTGTLTAYRTLKFHLGSLAHRWMFLFCLQDEFMNVFACV